MIMKPKILIIGHAKHGKDLVGTLLARVLNLEVCSSSKFMAKNWIWKIWGKDRYTTFEEMYEDRVTDKNRPVWANLISAYNTPNKARLAEEILEHNYSIYTGMRRRDEFEACKDKNLFNYVIWVDRSDIEPNESKDSMELTSKDADIIIENNSSVYNLKKEVFYVSEHINNTIDKFSKINLELTKEEVLAILSLTDLISGDSESTYRSITDNISNKIDKIGIKKEHTTFNNPYFNGTLTAKNMY